MMKNKSRRVLQQGRARAGLWVPLLLLLLLSMVVSGVIAQDGEPAGVDLVFEQDEFSASPQNVKAAAGEVYIPPSKDSFLASNDPNRNYGLDTLMRFGNSPSGLGATRPLFKYKVEAYIPSDAKISKAELHVYMTAIRDSDTSRGYAAHEMTQSWDEYSVTWNSMPSYGPEVGRGTLGTVPGWQVTDITNEVKDWLKNPQNNKGVILVGDERPGEDFERDYFTKEATSTGLTPQLYVKYDTNNDDVAPVANVVQPSEGAWSPANFVVKWEGNDPPNSDGSAGSGIKWYDVFYTTNSGSNWVIGRAQVTTTETNVTGAGHLLTVGLYARAMDNAGNEGPPPSGSGSIQTWTKIDAEPPQVTVNPLPEASSHIFTVSWQDTKEQYESGIRYYDVQWRVQNGQWQQLVYHTTATSTQFNQGQNGVTYEFRARGVDNVGNEQPWGDAQARTTVFTEPIAYIVIPFSPPIYPDSAPLPHDDTFPVQWVGIAPPNTSIVSFDVEYQRPDNPTWSQFYTGSNTSKQFVLNPVDPDGWYVFRARATDSAGDTGQFREDLYGAVLVNRDGNFSPLYLPAVFNN